jgi:hypothetical protein
MILNQFWPTAGQHVAWGPCASGTRLTPRHPEGLLQYLDQPASSPQVQSFARAIPLSLYIEGCSHLLPGRYLRHVNSEAFWHPYLLQCLRRLSDESRADDRLVVSLWKHETERIVKDQLCRYTDIAWFEETMQETMDNFFPSIANTVFPHFVTFPIDARSYQRPVTTVSRKEMKACVLLNTPQKIIIIKMLSLH